MPGELELDRTIMQTAATWWTELRDPDPSTDLLERWQAWMAADPAHAQAFAELNALGEMMAAAPPSLQRQCIDEFVPRQSLRLHWHQRWLAAAAVFVAALLGAGWMLRDSLEPAGPSRQYLSAVAQNRDIRLPDGTRVQLGAASKLVTHYVANRREIDLAGGEAFFTVTHDSSRPFEVAAGPLHIEDLGTAFNVRRTGERVSVAVTEGHVRLSLAKRAPAGASGRLDLLAGQRAEYDPATDMIKVSDVSAEHAAAWRDHRLEFVDEPLAMVVANVNRYSHRPVRLADPRLGRLMFTGTVNTTTIDSWLKGLPQIFPMRVIASADHVVLSDARRR